MTLIDKINDKSAHVGIIGLGYVGIPLALRISEVGYRVTGFDVMEARVAELNAGKSPIKHIADADITQMLAAGFEATLDFAAAKRCDALIICVPTPLNKAREPDLRFVTDTMKMLKPHMRAEQLLSLESTTWPGTTREILLPFVEQAGFEAGTSYYLVYSPEREDPGNADFTTHTIPKVLGGHTPACLAAGQALYGRLCLFLQQKLPRWSNYWRIFTERSILAYLTR